MTNLKTTKRALLSSVVALLVCFTMLLGTTFAWFTDSVTSAGNIIQTGTLDVSLEHADTVLGATDAGWTDASTGAIFNYSNWEPGYTAVKYVKIENEGTLDLRFILSIIPNNAAEAVNLADVIEVYMVDGAVAVDRAALTTDSAAYVGTLTSLMNENDGAAHGVLYADAAKGNVYEIYTIALKMSTTAGNEYMGKNVGGGFAVQLLATQLASESDSFDSDYDADATYPNVSVPIVLPETATENVTISVGGMDVDIPADVINALPEAVTSVSLVYSNPTTDVTNNTLTYDSIELVDQNGNAIDLEGNTDTLTVKLPAQNTFAVGEIVYIYHDGEYVAMATVNADGTISYEAAHFCEVVVSKEYNGEYIEVSDASSFSNGGAFKLTSNITADNGITIPTGVATIIDLNGYTIDAAEQFISNGGTLIIKGNGAINAKQINNQWDEENAVILTLEKGVTLNTSGSLSAINNNEETLVISGATINHSGSDYAIINYGVTTINDAIISSSTGVVKNVMGTTTINSGTFSHSGSMWSVVHQMYDGEIVINGGTFIHSGDDPLANVEYGGKLTVNGGTFDATSMFCGWADVTVNAGVFKNNATVVDYIGNISSKVPATSTATTNADGSTTVTVNN